MECSLWEQSCPDGEKCMPLSNDGGIHWEVTRCTPIAPDPEGLYEPCTVEGSVGSGLDSCELGAMCWDVDAETLVGTCIGLCSGTKSAPTCVDANAQCWVPADGVLSACLPICDPLEADACPPAQGCYPFLSAFHCAHDASRPEAGGAIDPCEHINSCDPGLLCAEAAVVEGCKPGGAWGCCTPYCDLADPVCSEPMSCLAYFTEGSAPVGLESVGFCGLEGS